MKHGKLVRDLIPNIIRANGEKPLTRTLRIAEFKREVKRKLQEEVSEVLETKTRERLVEKLADVQEVLSALYGAYGIECNEVTNAARKKRKARGAFAKRIFLIETK